MVGDRDEAVQRLRQALELYALGEEMMRQKLRRRHPAASEAEIEALLRCWLATRPGAPVGDAPGRPRVIDG